MSDFPRTFDEITPGWLTQVLHESGAINGERVDSFESTNIGDDQGLQGDVSRISLTHDSAAPDAPESLVIKFSLADDKRRVWQIQNGNSEREVMFYSELAADVGMAVPSVYFSQFDSDSGHMNIVQQDVGRFRAVDQSDDCSFDDATTTLNSLAQMNSKWWNSDRLFDYPWLKNQSDSDQLQSNIDRYNERLEGCFEILGDFLPVGFESLARKYQSRIAEINETYSRGAQTLVYGDYRTGNLVFDDSTTTESRVIEFDWAGASRAKPTSDVFYFMSLNFGIESRRQNESQLMSSYHERLIDLGVGDYSFDEFMDDARLGLFNVVSTAVIASAGIGKMVESEAGKKTSRCAFRACSDRYRLEY